MYENENNYVYSANYTPVEPEPPKGGKGKKAGKIAALILSIVLIGGASGFGGAYLANSMMTQSESVSENNIPVQSESTDAINIVTAVTQNPGEGDDAPLNNLLNADPSDSGELTTPEIIKRATPSVVLIQSTFDYLGSGTGTGIVLSSDGYIVTNCHVIQTSYEDYVDSGNYNPFSFFGGGYGFETQTVTLVANKVTVTTSDGVEYDAEIIGSDTNSDLALLKIDVEGLIPAIIGDSKNLVLGESVITLGYPLRLGLSASGGMVSGLEKEMTIELSDGSTTTMTLIQTDASINPGNSGGALINSRGEVVGITSSKLVDTDVEGIGFAIPITNAMSILDDLMNKGYVPVPRIGITGTNITSAVQRYYGLPVSSGVLVISVEEDSCAETAGITEGDVIVAVDGKEINDMDALVAAKNRHKPGDSMTITLARNNGNVDIEVVLDESPN